MRRRARRIRRAVASLAVALFATAFLIVYVQLASGHDPALVANAAKRHAATTSATSTTSTEATSTSATEASTAAESSSGSEESSSGASAVTTSQS
jgi:hypothetical protein